MILLINFFFFFNKSWRIVTLLKLFTFLLNFFKGKPLWLNLLYLWDSYTLERRKMEILFTYWFDFINSKAVTDWLIVALGRNLSVLLRILYLWWKFWLILSSYFLEIIINFAFRSLPPHPLCIISFCIELLRFLNWRDNNLRATFLFGWILDQ